MRRFLLLLFWSVAALAVPGVGCSSSSTPVSPMDAGAGKDAPVDHSSHPMDAKPDRSKADAGPFGPVPPAWNANVKRPASDSAAQAARAACSFKRGDMPAASVDVSFPLDADNPIQNIVVLMEENRSFDTHLGHLYKYEGVSATAINSAPDTTTNPDSMGMPHPYQHAPQLCFADTDHSWKGSHTDWDSGKNDGFYIVNNGTMLNEAGTNLLDGDRALWWYDQTDIPFAYSLYSTFAMSDSYFCPTLGPTYPNRDYLYAGTSFGVTSDVFPNLSAEQQKVTSYTLIFDELAQRDIAFKIYLESTPGVGTVIGAGAALRWSPLAPIGFYSDFVKDAKAGTLPPVTFVDPNLAGEGPAGDDEHPPAQIQVGEQFIWQVVNAVLTSPQWAHTALFITYDEAGGQFDHVSPPSACLPDNIPPILTGSDVGTTGTFDRYGFRVPIVVISPYAKKAFVSHRVYSHTSITRFIEAKFKIPALTARDANADPFTDMFDWTSPPFAKPPSFTEPTVDNTALTFCKANYTNL